ncbi:hypothetical protein ONZ45_g4305 [Pleurotus djamor]|nr:hypothetical protein ONZ45_g4305 [Pleurotus djamor]
MPGPSDDHRSSQEALPLTIVIVGGSLAGLAAGYALRKAGHDVFILEKDDESTSHTRGGGVHCPPNMTRILDHWGLHPHLEQVTSKCSGFDMIDGANGELLGLVRLHERMMLEVGADYLYVKYSDLHRILLSAALSIGVEIKFSSKVVHVDSRNATVILDNGESLQGDIVIGADGHGSLVRQAFINDDDNESHGASQISFVTSIPREILQEHDDLTGFLETSQCLLWLGNRFFVFGYYVQPCNEFNINGYMPRKTAKLSPSELHGTWQIKRPIEELDFDMSRLEPRLKKLLQLAKVATPTMYTLRQPFDSYMSDCCKAVVIGEAAHPMLPNAAHNAAMSIEDAATLGHLFSRIQHRDQIPRLMSAFEELRQPRCVSTTQHEIDKRDVFSLPPGEEQHARDTGLREAMAKEKNNWDEIDDDYFKWKYERELELFPYDPYEVVDDWWAKWGMLLDRSSGRRTDSVPALDSDSR